MAFGQFGVVVDPAKVDVACPDEECHVAPVFMGEGGFVGELADGFDMANFVVSCGNTTASGTAPGDGGGVVRQLFSMANGLACHSEGGSIQIHGLADGGWYWINDDMNSAVSPLIAKDALMGDEVMPTDPGGVTLMASDYGTYVKSGSRVGILPHFVPTAPVEIPEHPEPEAAVVCMPYWDGGDRVYKPGMHDCELGDGGTEIVMWLPSENRGRGAVISGSVTRPANASADALEIQLQLWGNGSGHIAPGTNASALRGWNISTPSNRAQPAPFDADFAVFKTDGTSFAASQAGITVTPGGRGTRLQMVPVPSANHESTTVWLDSGHSDDDGTPDCEQDRQEGRGVGAPMVIAFQPAMGKDTVWVPADNDEGGAPIGGAASDADAASWAAAYNTAAATDDDMPAIKVFTHDGTDDIPLVVCKMEEKENEVAVNAMLRIEHSTAYCGQGRNVAANVVIHAPHGAAHALNDDIVPPLSRLWLGGGWQAAAAELTVLCP